MESIPFSQLKDIGGMLLLIVSLFTAVKYLQKRNDLLVEKQEASRAASEANYIGLIKEVAQKHEECNERYTALMSKSSEAISNNTRVMEHLIDKLEYTAK